MSNLKPTNARWRMLVLGTLWILELFAYASCVVMLGLVVGVTSYANGTGRDTAIQAWVVVNLVMACVGALLTCLEIVMHSHMDLTPTMFLIFGLIKTTLALLSVAIDAYATSQTWFKQEYNKYFVYVAIGWSAVIFVISIASLVYGGIMFHRYRTRMQDLLERYI